MTLNVVARLSVVRDDVVPVVGLEPITITFLRCSVIKPIVYMLAITAVCAIYYIQCYMRIIISQK